MPAESMPSTSSISSSSTAVCCERVVSVQRQEKLAICVFVNRTNLLVSRLLASHVAIGDDIAFPVSTGDAVRTEILITKNGRSGPNRYLYQVPIRYVSQPKQGKRNQHFVSAEVHQGGLSGKRERTPEILDVEEMQLLLASLGVRERALVFLDMPAGLRRGELAGLKWEDVDFKHLHLNVSRSLVDQHVGPVKTEVSRKLMPIDAYVARDLMAWYEQTPYKQPSDYLWATDANRAGSKRGKQPVWLSTVMRDHIQPMATQLGINKRIGWHTFRHTFSTLLKSNGEDVKVVQELLRHSTSRMTLDTYTQALSPDKRAAQSRVVGMIRPKPTCTVVVPRETDQISRKALKRFGVPVGEILNPLG